MSDAPGLTQLQVTSCVGVCRWLGDRLVTPADGGSILGSAVSLCATWKVPHIPAAHILLCRPAWSSYEQHCGQHGTLKYLQTQEGLSLSWFAAEIQGVQDD